MDQMWSTLEKIQFGNDANKVFLHQSLSRSTSEKSISNNEGYDYIHYPPINQDHRERLRLVLGSDGENSVGRAFEFITELGSLHTKRLLETIDPSLNGVVDNVLGDLDGSFQRLARYKQASDENIRPHCDWSFVTIVPVSNVFGLEVYDGRAWVKPEQVAQNDYMQRQRYDGNSNNEHVRWNSFYITVMTGKWIELMSKGSVPSLIHRVEGGSEDRLSAPLFVRPKEDMNESLAKAFAIEAKWSFNRCRDELVRCLHMYASSPSKAESITS